MFYCLIFIPKLHFIIYNIYILTGELLTSLQFETININKKITSKTTAGGVAIITRSRLTTEHFRDLYLLRPHLGIHISSESRNVKKYKKRK